MVPREDCAVSGEPSVGIVVSVDGSIVVDGSLVAGGSGVVVVVAAGGSLVAGGSVVASDSGVEAAGEEVVGSLVGTAAVVEGAGEDALGVVAVVPPSAAADPIPLDTSSDRASTPAANRFARI